MKILRFLKTKSLTIHTFLITTIIIYLIFANIIFGNFKVGEESTKVLIDTNTVNQNIIFSLANPEEKQVDWKNLIKISGWAFIDKIDSKNSEIYVALKSNKEMLLFNTMQFQSPNVTKYFESKKINLDNSNFESQIDPEGLIKDLNYNIGILIVNGKQKALKFTENYLSIRDNKIFKGFISEKTTVN